MEVPSFQEGDVAEDANFICMVWFAGRYRVFSWTDLGVALRLAGSVAMLCLNVAQAAGSAQNTFDAILPSVNLVIGALLATRAN